MELCVNILINFKQKSLLDTRKPLYFFVKSALAGHDITKLLIDLITNLLEVYYLKT